MKRKMSPRIIFGEALQAVVKICIARTFFFERINVENEAICKDYKRD